MSVHSPQGMKIERFRWSAPESSFPRTRESRFGYERISLDTRFRGYDEPMHSGCHDEAKYNLRKARRGGFEPPYKNFVHFMASKK